MAGTIKGSAPRSLQKSTMARVMVSTFATPLLPAVIAMLMPGWIVSAISGRESSFRTIDGISAGSMWLLSNACSARNISGIGMPSSIRETFPPFFIFISSLLFQSMCVLICVIKIVSAFFGTVSQFTAGSRPTPAGPLLSWTSSLRVESLNDCHLFFPRHRKPPPWQVSPSSGSQAL